MNLKKFELNKKELIKNCFNIIQQVTNKQFVTLRGFDEIPDQISVNNDIDIMVCGSHIIPFLDQTFKNLGFTLYVDNHSYMYGAEPHYQFVNNKLDVKLDIVTGLYYRSINDKMLWIPINKEVQKSMIANKINVEEMWKSQPSPEDELVHIVCHCIFDKRKTTQKYIDRIKFLLTIINEDKVKYLMERAFYASWTSVYNLLKTDPTNLYKEYIQYTNY